ncbi:paraquat-inducible protein A [Halioxenophilus aromaticivorans]|uniref:paraquat-inducible protein A n=1 Tax=Halioxenophilus aromaticivorans TaxID=1306992 RepID=UPI0031E66ACF
MDDVAVSCHECNLRLPVPKLAPNQAARCPRCGYTITSLRRNWAERTIAFSLAGLLLMAVSLPFTYISFSTHGLTESITLLSSLDALSQQGYALLSVSVALACLIAPAAVLLLMLYLAGAVRFGWRVRHPQSKINLCFSLIPWCMAEIFTVGVLVSLVKIISMADIIFGITFFTYSGFAICFLSAMLYFDRFQVERHLVSSREQHHIEAGKSIQFTWALLVTAIILYIPANLLPIMTTRFLGSDTPATVMGGVVTLWHHGSYPIAAVIFIASIFVPVAKMGIMVWLNTTVHRRSVLQPAQRTFWYRVTEVIGRWSMVDVFVVAVLVSLVQLDNTMSIYPGPAVISFCGVVILTMIAANTFDCRLIWMLPQNYDKSR